MRPLLIVGMLITIWFLGIAMAQARGQDTQKRSMERTIGMQGSTVHLYPDLGR